ncbi:SufE family protein [Roseibium sp. AS2]|uniref:SufE family protein n=1 Tax=Roseibium sp. AS2 TaxID=3135781 RepID=UPI00316BC54F
MTASLSEILETFEFLDDWEDRYKYLIDLGREMPDLSADEKTDANKVRGCVSQVWLITSIEKGTDGSPVLTFKGDSDALIVQGLVAIVTALFSGKSAREILETDVEEIFSQLGLQDHLTPQRSNGLRSMVGRIRTDAQQALEAACP